MTAELHLAENALTLHLFLQRLEGLVDVIVANEYLHACSFVVSRSGFIKNPAVARIFESGGSSRKAVKSPQLPIVRSF